MPENSKAAAPAPAPAPVAPAPAPIFAPPVSPAATTGTSLDAWAQSRSLTDRRVELLSSFVAITRRKGRTYGAMAEFDAAFQAFANATA